MSNNQDPWNRGGNKPEDDLDKMAKELQEKLKRFFGGGGDNDGSQNTAGGGGLPQVGGFLLLLLIIWALAGGLYIVDDTERGVVKRFGEHVRTTSPGLHWHVPKPIETVTKVKVTDIRNASFSKKMLTKDENIVDVEINIQYLASNPEKFLFNVRDPETTLIEVSRSAIREIVGKNDLDYIITTNRQNIGPLTEERIQQTLDSYDVGIEITAVNIVNANFPLEVNDAVQDAIRAREDKETSIFEAQTYANDIVPKSRGEAGKRLEDAGAYKAQEIADAEGEASRFNQLLVEYEKAPEVTRKRLYLETVEEVYGKTGKVIMDSDGSGNLIYLPVDQLIKNNKPAKPVQPKQQPSIRSNQSTVTGTSARERPTSRGGR